MSLLNRPLYEAGSLCVLTRKSLDRWKGKERERGEGTIESVWENERLKKMMRVNKVEEVRKSFKSGGWEVEVT